MTHPDFRALCAELLGALADQWVGDERPDPDVVIRARAALATPEPLPLWRVMRQANCNFGTPVDLAAEIKALRDYLPMVPPEEFVEQWANEPSASMASMTARTMEWVCSLLTEQARIARGENDLTHQPLLYRTRSCRGQRDTVLALLTMRHALRRAAGTAAPSA